MAKTSGKRRVVVGDRKRSKSASESASVGASSAFKFDYKGRLWTMELRGAVWYLRAKIDKKRIFQSCAADKRAAEAEAKIKIDAALGGRLDVLRASLKRQEAATPACCIVGEVLSTYENATDLDVAAGPQARNVQAMRNAIRRALGLPFPEKKATFAHRRALDLQVDNLSSAIFKRELAEDYYSDMRTRANKLPDQTDQNRLKLSAGSLLFQGLSVFKPALLAKYRRAGLVLPSTLEDFIKACRAERPTGLNHGYNPPPESVIRRTLHEWLKLDDRNMFIALGLELACGLRRSEVVQIRSEMLTVSNKRPLLDGRRTQVKGQTGRIVVPPIDPFWTLLMRRMKREGWQVPAGQLLIQGTPTQIDDMFRGIGHWLRGLGWDTQKTNHALRAYSGSLVAMKWDIYRASAWLRHASVKVTEAHYTHFLNERVFTPEKIRVAWALTR
ncbi:MAG TPA: tyrosine-type recombinase/integrase [Verrucomicrobiae bacterium]